MPNTAEAMIAFLRFAFIVVLPSWWVVDVFISPFLLLALLSSPRLVRGVGRAWVKKVQWRKIFSGTSDEALPRQRMHGMADADARRRSAAGGGAAAQEPGNPGAVETAICKENQIEEGPGKLELAGEDNRKTGGKIDDADKRWGSTLIEPEEQARHGGHADAGREARQGGFCNPGFHPDPRQRRLLRAPLADHDRELGRQIFQLALKEKHLVAALHHPDGCQIFQKLVVHVPALLFLSGKSRRAGRRFKKKRPHKRGPLDKRRMREPGRFARGGIGSAAGIGRVELLHGLADIHQPAAELFVFARRAEIGGGFFQRGLQIRRRDARALFEQER